MTIPVRHNDRFTLIELLVSLGVFALLMVLLLQFISMTERTWTLNEGAQKMLESQRIALELIERDLNSAITSSLPGEEIGLYVADPEDDGFITCFVASSSSNKSAAYRLCEINYRVDGNRLQRQLITSREAEWDFFANTETVDPSWVNKGLDTYETLLDEGVSDLEINFYRSGSDSEPMAAGVTFELPARAEVTLVLHDPVVGAFSEQKRLATQKSYTRVIYLNKLISE